MTLAQALSLFGFPTFFLGVVGFFVKKLKTIDAENRALKKGVQALLQNELLKIYMKYETEKKIPRIQREIFDNCYTQYHSLGANGIMDGIKEQVESWEITNLF